MPPDTRRAGAVLMLVFLAAACRNGMRDQPRYDPLEASAFFRDNRSARHLPEGVVPRGRLELDQLLYTGRVDGEPAERFPFPITPELLLRGQERFNIYCAPCHSMTGDGDGMIVRRGFRKPPSFLQERLRQAPLGHYFDVITNGFGAMPSYSYLVPPADRWAIIAHIRTLQLTREGQASTAANDGAAQAGPAGAERRTR